MKPLIAILHPFQGILCERILSLVHDDFAVVVTPSACEDDLAATIADADFAVALAAPVTARVIGAARRLKLIHKWGVGVDTIDLEAARQAGVWVANTPGRNASAVADLAIGLMLAVSRRLPLAQARLRDGCWDTGDLWLTAAGFSGRTVGLIGCGAIGQAVARRLRGFDCPILYINRTRLDPLDEQRLGVAWTSLPDLLRTSDIVSLHLPLAPETRELIGAPELRRMKRSALLVNVSRGGLVDEAALVDALETGVIAGAGLDVFAQEPPAPNHPLLAIESVVATPHIGGKTADNLTAVVHHWMSNIRCMATAGSLPASDVVIAGRRG